MTDEKPQGFDDYWQSVLDELERIPPAPEIEEIPLRSTDFATAYGIRLTSIGPYRIFGYLSIPRGQGPFPARYFLPRYGSVVDLVPQGTSNGQRGQYVTFSICARGQRRADEPYSAAFPGMLTDGIDNPDSYVYRGIVADCLRGLEYLGQTLTHLVSTPTILFRTVDTAARTSAYPLEEINDYLRLHPDREASVRETLAHFDLRWFAPRVSARTLVVSGADGTALDAAALEPLTGAIPGQTEVYKSRLSGFRDGVFAEEWLAREMGLGEAALPPHWRS